MPVKIRRTQPLSYYVAKFRIPIITNLLVSLVSILVLRLKFAKFLKKPYIFDTIEIETFNRCNNDCSFCPANRNVDKRTPCYMSEKLFSKIIDQLVEIDFSGNVNLFINNEPLIDKRLEKFIEEVTSKLPKSTIFILTNGLLLNHDRLKSLYDAGLKNIIIDNYNDKMKINSNVKKMLDDIRGSEIEKNMNIVVWLRYKNAVLTNRTGSAPNKKYKFLNFGEIEKNIILRRSCGFVIGGLNITPEGKVPICCADVYGKHIIGDVNKEKIVDIWYGEKSSMIREELFNKGRFGLYPCNMCDKL
jgi:hypothetical protein